MDFPNSIFNFSSLSLKHDSNKNIHSCKLFFRFFPDTLLPLFNPHLNYFFFIFWVNKQTTARLIPQTKTLNNVQLLIAAKKHRKTNSQLKTKLGPKKQNRTEKT
jgi:hypothetical protein